MPDVGLNWARVLSDLLAQKDLNFTSVKWAIESVMSGQATDAQIAGFLVALRAKGPVSVTELSVLADTMLTHAVPVQVPGRTIDIVGTGGDMKNTVNISTMAAITVAATGRTVVKHGSRSASSACGAADVVEELGVRLLSDPADIAAVAAKVGITFCFAQALHPAMKYVAGVRRELAIPTVFNYLGPLANPARPKVSALGVADEAMAHVMAQVLARRGDQAWVFRGDDGMDEVSTYAPTTVWVVRDGTVEKHWIDPRRLGIESPQLGDLVGEGPQFNAQVVKDYVAGKTGPVRNAVLLNAAAAILADQGLVAGELYEDLSHVLKEVATAVDEGQARHVLDSWIAAGEQIESGSASSGA